MRKSILILGLIFLSLPTFAETRGDTKDYYAEITCPNDEVIEIRGKCCEPGSVWLCNFPTCANYNPPSPQCPSIGS